LNISIGRKERAPEIWGLQSEGMYGGSLSVAAIRCVLTFWHPNFTFKF